MEKGSLMMKKVFGSVAALALIVSVFGANSGFCGVYDELTAAQQKALQNGSQVIVKEDSDDSVWPIVRVYQRVDAAPEEVAAVFADFAIHKDLFTGIVKSEITKKISNNVYEVDYRMTFPTLLGIQLKDEDYTVRDTITEEDGTYQITWEKVRAMTMKDTSGSVRVERLGTASIFCYENFISPPRPTLAKLIVQMFVDRTKESADQLAKRVVAERTSDRAQLERQLDFLKKALN